MCIKSCQCYLKISQIQHKISKIIEEIWFIKNRNYSLKFDSSKGHLAKENLTQTLLLDFSETEQPPKYTFGSIHQTLTKLNTKINEFQLKCTILPSLIESISKQTEIIHYLQSRIQGIASEKCQIIGIGRLASHKDGHNAQNFRHFPIALRKQRKIPQPSRHVNQLVK